jgi:hypothetical protein
MRLGRVANSATGRTAVAGTVKAFKLIVVPIILFAVLSAGCAPTRTGATLDDLNKKVGGPAGGQTRVVVIRQKEMTMFDTGWQVYLDGAVMGDLKTGTFVYRDRLAGPHKLMFARPGEFARASSRDFVASSGRTYVFRLEMNDKGNLVRGGGAAAGLAGMLITSAIAHSADERGLYDFTLLEGEFAKQALADIHLSE